MKDLSSLSACWQSLRQQRPLVLCITNRVTPQRVADTLLAAGASPVMADNPAEVAQMASLADALYVNTGLHQTQESSLESVCKLGKRYPKPIVLDPVGTGATAYRTASTRNLLNRVRPTAIRGNASEVIALAGEGRQTRGVDSSEASEAALSSARTLVELTRSTVAVSGERDLVTDGKRVYLVGGGHVWLTRVTGAGCALGALTAACIAASEQLVGTLTAHAAYALAARRAAQSSAGPGTFGAAFLDELYRLQARDFQEADIEVMDE